MMMHTNSVPITGLQKKSECATVRNAVNRWTEISPNARIAIGMLQSHLHLNFPKKRTTAMTYLYVLGIFGAHRFYVGKTDSGALMLASSIVALSLFIVGLVLTGLFSLFVGYALMITGLIVLIIESIFLLNDRHALLAGTLTDSDGQYLS